MVRQRAKRKPDDTEPESQNEQSTSDGPTERVETDEQSAIEPEEEQHDPKAAKRTKVEAGPPAASSSSTSSRHVIVNTTTGPMMIPLQTDSESSTPERGFVIDTNPVHGTDDGDDGDREQQPEPESLLDMRRLGQANSVLNRHCTRRKMQLLRPPSREPEAMAMLLNIVARPQMTALVERARAQLANASQGQPLNRKVLYSALTTINHEAGDADLFKDEPKPSDTYVVAAHMYVYCERYGQQCDTLSRAWAVHMILSQLYIKYEPEDHRMLERLVVIPSQVYPHTVKQAVDLATNWDFVVADTNRHAIEPVPDVDNPATNTRSRPGDITNIGIRHTRPLLRPTQQLIDARKKYQAQLRSDEPMQEGTKIPWKDLRYLVSNKLALASDKMKESFGNTQIHYTESILKDEQTPVEDVTDKELADERSRLQLQLRDDCTTQSVNGAEYELTPSQRLIDSSILLQIMDTGNIETVVSAQRPGYELAFSTEHVAVQYAEVSTMPPQQRNGYTLRALPKGPDETRRRRQKRMLDENGAYTRNNNERLPDNGLSQGMRAECAVVTHEVYLGYTTRPGIEYIEEVGLLYGEMEANTAKQADHLLNDMLQFTETFPCERFAECILHFMSHGAIRTMHIKICQKVLNLLKSLRRTNPDNQQAMQTLEQLHTVRANVYRSLNMMEYYLTRLHDCYPIHWSPTELMIMLDQLRSSSQKTKRTFLAPIDDVATNEECQKPIVETWTTPMVPLRATLVNVANEHEIDGGLTYMRGDSPFPFNMRQDMMMYLTCWKGSHDKYRKITRPEVLEVPLPTEGAAQLMYGDFIRERAYLWPQANFAVNYQQRLITHAPAAGILHVVEPFTAVDRSFYSPTLLVSDHEAPSYTAAVNIRPYLRPAPPSNDPDLRMEQAITDLYGFFRSKKEGSKTLTVRSQAEPTPDCELNPRAPVPVIYTQDRAVAEWTEEETGGEPMPMLKPPLSLERSASRMASNVNHNPIEMTNEQGRSFKKAVQRCFIKEGDSKPSIDRRQLARTVTIPIREGLQSLPSAIHNFTLLTGRPAAKPVAYTMAMDPLMVDECVTEIKKGMEKSLTVGFSINPLRVDDQLRAQFRELHKPNMTEEEQAAAHKHYSKLLIKYAGYIPFHLAQFNPDPEQYMSLIAGFTFALHDGSVFIIPAHVAVRPDRHCQLQESLAKLLYHTEDAKN